MKPFLYEVGAAARFTRLADALSQWGQDAPVDAIVEITDSATYAECISLALKQGQALELRASARQRPVIRLELSVSGATDTGFQLEGLTVTGCTVRIGGNLADVTIRHCTLVPGWGEQRNPGLEVSGAPTRITLDHSVVGAIQVERDACAEEPLQLHINDSIVDAVSLDRAALGASGKLCAHADVTIQRSTIFGQLHAQSIELAQDSLLLGTVYARRGQSGCIRFCYVAPGSHTPRRHECQPDLVEQKVSDLYRAGDLTVAERNALIASERLRVEPEFDSSVYGTPTYCQLASTCAPEISTGATDESEMGVSHARYYPGISTSAPPRSADRYPA